MNELINNQLTYQLKAATSDFLRIKKVYTDYQAIYDNYLGFDFGSFSDRTMNSLVKNCSENWMQTSEESLYSILFEYSDDWPSGEIVAAAYGINSWQVPVVSTIDFEMERYELSDSFYSKPAFSLDLLNPFTLLDREEYLDFLDDKLDYEIPGYEELVKVFNSRINLEVHKTLMMFSTTQEYKKVNKQKYFMFLIGLHDKGIQTPLFVDI